MALCSSLILSLHLPSGQSLHRDIHKWIPHSARAACQNPFPMKKGLSVPARRLAVSRASNGQNVRKSSWDAIRAAIFEVEFMVREPAEVLGGLQECLSTRDLEVMLVYFSQDGRDSWCALEVFEWMHHANMVEDETRELMMSIMSQWLMKLVQQRRSIEEIRSLIRDMNCVGLVPEPGIIQSIVSTYWDRGEVDTAVEFVKDMVQAHEIGQDAANQALVLLLLKMARDQKRPLCIMLISEFRNSGFKLSPEVYNAALLAAVAEQKQLTQTMRVLAMYQKRGLVAELEDLEKNVIEAYERNLHKEAEQIARWAMDVEVSGSAASVHEKLLAMYCIAGRGLEAEHQLWQMKLAGGEITVEAYDTVIGICAYKKHVDAARRIMKLMKAVGVTPNKRTFSALLGGFIKGGHILEAAKALQEMLEKGFIPDDHDTMLVLKELKKSRKIFLYIKLCQKLSEIGLIGPFLVYLYIDYLKLCIIKML